MNSQNSLCHDPAIRVKAFHAFSLYWTEFILEMQGKAEKYRHLEVEILYVDIFVVICIYHFRTVWDFRVGNLNKLKAKNFQFLLIIKCP